MDTSYTQTIEQEDNHLTSKNLIEMLDMMEKLRPEYAILLNDFIEDDVIFEMENPNLDKYYCKKLLIMNTKYYRKIQTMLENNKIDLRVY